MGIHPSNPRSKSPRERSRKLANDGLPKEMFEDVKRASHLWLMTSPKAGIEGQQYRSERLKIDAWMASKGINNPYNTALQTLKESLEN